MTAAVTGTLLTACKDNQKADVIKENTTSEVSAPAGENPVIQQQGDLIAEAQSKPLTNLVLSENHYEFGKIKKGDVKEHVYEVTNTGDNPLIISAVKPGCGCTAPEYTKEPILPGQKGQITLKFDSANFDGLVNKQAEVYANVEKTPILITFSADIQP